MALLAKIKYVIHVFRNSKDKKHMLAKVVRVLKRSGMSGLKSAIKESGQKQENERDLYERQQEEKKDYCQYPESVLFIIYAVENDIDISDTYKTIHAQKKVCDRIVAVTRLSMGSVDAECEMEECDVPQTWTTIKKLVSAASEDYVFLIRGGDYVAPNMRDEFAQAMANGKSDIIYSDECIFDNNNGQILRYYVKPDYHVFDVYQYNMMQRSVMFHREILEAYMALAVETDNFESIMLEWSLNMVEKAENVCHIDRVLLLRKNTLEKNDVREQRFIIEHYLKSSGIRASVFTEADRVKICPLIERQKIAIAIIAKERTGACHCIESIINHTHHVEYELAIVADAECAREVQQNIGNVADVTYILCDKEMSYTKRCNLAARNLECDVLVFVQDDMEIVQSDWLSNMVGEFAFPKVAAVSPKVVRGDHTIRYAGMIAGGFGFTPIPFNGEMDEFVVNRNEPAFLNRRVSVLSASCMVVKKAVFEEIGGFEELQFEDKFSNAQMSFSLQRAGYSCVYCADSVVVSRSENWYDSWFEMEHQTAYINLLKGYGEELSGERCFTESMKQQYLRGVPVGFRIYQKKKIVDKGSILMVSHDSLLGGATIAFQYAARSLKEAGYFVVWLVENEGGMLRELEEDGIAYIVDPSYKGGDGWLECAKNFDLIMCSTITLCPQVEKLKNLGKHVLWWVHEAEDYYKRELLEGFSRKGMERLHVFCGGIFAEKTFKAHFEGIDTRVLLYGVPDYAKNIEQEEQSVIENAGGRIVFLSIGTFERRKGQDILAEAISRLDKNVLDQCLFVFIGKPVQEDVYEEIKKVKMAFPEAVRLMEPVDRKTLMQIYQEGDVVMCTSREDPMPVFMTECMMHSRVAICSENTGTAGVMTDGQDGFVYCNNSADELAQKITYVAEHIEKMDDVKRNARATYERNFSMQVFERNIINYVQGILKE